MWPQTNSGEVVVYRSDMTTAVYSRVYVMEYDGEHFLKRLYKHKDILLIFSDILDTSVGPMVFRKSEMNRVRIIGLAINRTGRIT